jgi:hypothetical protein
MYPDITTRLISTGNVAAPTAARSELDPLDKEGRQVRDAIDKYLTAFETGSMPTDVCGPSS